MAATRTYLSDVKDEEWAFVAPYRCLMSEDAPQRSYALRDVFNALRYYARPTCCKCITASSTDALFRLLTQEKIGAFQFLTVLRNQQTVELRITPIESGSARARLTEAA